MRRDLRWLRIILSEQSLQANRKQQSRRNENRRAPAQSRPPAGCVDNIHDAILSAHCHTRASPKRTRLLSAVGRPFFFRAYRLTRGPELPQTLPDDKIEIFYALSLLFLDFSRVLDVGGNCGLGTADRRTIVLSVCFHDYFIL